jgi:hypothetical protein
MRMRLAHLVFRRSLALASLALGVAWWLWRRPEP